MSAATSAGQPFIQFGSGLLWLNPLSGNLAVNPTPVRPFTIQDIKVDLGKGKLEELRGQLQYPDDVATGDKSGTFEFSMGRQDWNFLNQVFNADLAIIGGTTVTASAATVVPPTPFHITPTIPGAGTFGTDLGVYNSATLAQFQKVTGTPVAGEYSFAAGVYTFSSADNVSGISVIVNFSFTTTTGNTYEVNNQVQGWGPVVEIYLQETYQPLAGIYSVIHLFAAKISEASKDNKRSGYSMIAIKGSYYSNSGGQVANYYSNVG